MNKTQELRDFKGVYTNADTADIQDGFLEELQNLEHLPGKLVKTYSAGTATFAEESICALVAGTGYDVINIYTYINENLSEGYVYLAVVRATATGITYVLQFYGNPTISKLLVWGSSSFYIDQGATDNYDDGDIVPISGVTVTEGGSSYGLSSSLSDIYTVTGEDSSGFEVYSGVPPELGVPYNLNAAGANISPTSTLDAYVTFKGDITSTTLSDDSFRIGQIVRYNDITFMLGPGKPVGPGQEGKVFYYDGSWHDYDASSFGLTVDTNDVFEPIHLAVFNKKLYAVVQFTDWDASTTTIYVLSKTSTGSWTNVFNFDNTTEEYAARYATGAGSSYWENNTNVTSAVCNVNAKDYLYLGFTGTTATHGKVYYIADDDTDAEATLPTITGSSFYVESVCPLDGGECLLSIYDATTTYALLYTTNGSAGTFSSVTLPSVVAGIGAQTTLYKSLKFMRDMGDGNIGIFAQVKYQLLATPFWVLLVYDTDADTMSVVNPSLPLYLYDEYAPTCMEYYDNELGSRFYYGLTYYDAATEPDPPYSNYAYYTRATGDASASELYFSEENLVGAEVRAIGVYSAYDGISDVSSNKHMVAVSVLLSINDMQYGDNLALDIYRLLGIGANEAYAPYGGTYDIGSSFSACLGWREISYSGNAPVLYHKNDKNPIILDRGSIRILPGAIGEVSGNEAKGLWVGYIDRDYYDELYTADSEYTAGFFGYDKTPLAPVAYGNIGAVNITSGPLTVGDTYVYYTLEGGDSFANVGGPAYGNDIPWVATGTTPTTWTNGTILRKVADGDLVLYGFGGNDEYRYVRYSFVYDGTQESLLSEPSYTQIDTDIDKAYFRLKLNDGTTTAVRSGLRITSIRVYLSSGVGLLSTNELIAEIPLTQKIEKHNNYSPNGKALKYVWIRNVAEVDKPEALDYFRATAAGPFSQILSVEDLGGDGVLLELDEELPSMTFDMLWELSTDGLTGYADSDAGAYGGLGTIIDTSVDFNKSNPIGLTVASSSSDGGYALYSARGSDYALDVADVAKYAISVNASGNNETDFKYSLDVSPYLFYTDGSSYYVYAILDFANTEGTAYALEGSPSIKVNGDFAMISGGRLWSLSNILDPGGENEEQLSGLNYSEVAQYDVMPVGNFIPFNDREGGGGTGLAELFTSQVIAFKQNLSLLVSTDPDPANWYIKESPHNIGNIAKRGMVSAAGKVYICYYDGIYALSANNLAETDMTQTERLRVSEPINDKYMALTLAQKEAIVGEYDQSKTEILWTLGSELWALSVDTGFWREIVQTPTMEIVTLDENAAILFYDSSDGAFRTFTIPGTASPLLMTKNYIVGTDRPELLRSFTVFNPYDDAMTVKAYMDDTLVSTTVVPADTTQRKIPVRYRGYEFKVELSWATSTDNVEFKRIGIEYDN